MCDQLHRNGIMTKPSVIAAFRSVPRGFFVPESAQGSAYDDAPLRHGCVHLSAPHIYGAIGDALDMHKGMSFLNIGSGTGYERLKTYIMRNHSRTCKYDKISDINR